MILSNLMEYKGYHAKIEFSAEDNTFIGRVIGINDVIAFDGENVEELSATFRDSIDDYLASCAEMGKDPDKEYKGSFNVRISPELHKKAVIKAESQNISLNQFIQLAIEHEILGYNTKEVVTIVMPQKTIENYSIKKGLTPFSRYDFDRKEDIDSCQTLIKFPVSES